MSSNRWLNLLLWGLGDRMDGVDDYRSNILMLVDVLIWISLFSFLLFEGPGLFLVLWLLAPLKGLFIDWIGTQVIIGYLMTRQPRRTAKPSGAGPTAQPAQPPHVPPGPSEEP